MIKTLSLIALSLTVMVSFTQITNAKHHKKDEGFVSLFDGKSLKGWDGDPKFWSVEEGAITGITTKETPTKGNTFIIFNGKDDKPDDFADFDLQFEYRIMAGNSGVQYRSFRRSEKPDKWRIGGYQGDFEAGDRFTGIVYGEGFRGILCNRGDKTTLSGEKGKPDKKVEKFGDSKEIGKAVKKKDWNSFRVVAKGYTFTQWINGVKTAELIDNHKDHRDKGWLAFQLHAGPPMKVQFRNVRIKELKK